MDLWIAPVYLLIRTIDLSPEDPVAKRRLYGCGIAKIEQLRPDAITPSLAQAVAMMRQRAADGAIASTVVDNAGATARQAVTGQVKRIDVASFSPDRIRLKVEVLDGAALVVIYDSIHPWWAATVDGAATPILAANIAFKCVVVPQGAHELILSIANRQIALRLLEFALLCFAQAAALYLVTRTIWDAAVRDSGGT
jgi:hypothetical protein